MKLGLMSCRVLKRGMEDAMLDTLVCDAGKMGLKAIIGYYYPTPKNNMVKEFYSRMGFEKIGEIDGVSVFKSKYDAGLGFVLKKAISESDFDTLNRIEKVCL